MTQTTDTTGRPVPDAAAAPEAGTAGFAGWPADAPAFLAELAEDNTRAFWLANVHRYRAAVLAPTRALAVALAPGFGTARVFRPYVDRRYRPDADPYRTDTGLTAAAARGAPFALVLSPHGLAVQVGYRLFDTGQLRRYRDAVDGDAGERLVEVLARLHDDGLVPDGVPAVATRPRGCPRDHPRLPLMRLRALHVDRAWPAGAWLATAEPLERVRTAWTAARPLADWLDRHVGPRAETASPEDAGTPSPGSAAGHS